MRVLLSTQGSRGDVEPLEGRALTWRALGTEVRVCAPPGTESAEPPGKELAELLAEVGVALVPVGRPVRPLVTGATPSAADAPRRAAELVAARVDTVAGPGRPFPPQVADNVDPWSRTSDRSR